MSYEIDDGEAYRLSNMWHKIHLLRDCKKIIDKMDDNERSMFNELYDIARRDE